jgi:phage terminase large subunit-like protein
VGAAAARLGKPFMPWQQLVADVALEIDPVSGRLVYPEAGLEVPRQSGKSTFVEAKGTHRCTATGFFGDRQHVVYTAQTRQKAREKWEEDFAADLENSVAFRSRVHVSKANGNEHIRFVNGSRWGLEAATEKAGHGSTIDEAYLDEAFAHQDWRLEQALGPAMITRALKQLWWISTAGWLGGSPYLEAKTETGRRAVVEGRREGLAYFEWSAPEDADPGDERVWWACMPALGHTISVEAIRAEYVKALDQQKLNEFRRAYLNQWVPKDSPDEWSVVPERTWRSLADGESHPAGRVVFAAAFAHDQSHAAVGLAGWRPDGLLHVEVANYGPGTAWVGPYLADRYARHNPLGIVVDDGSHERSVIKDLEAASIEVMRPGARGVAEGYSDFVEDAADSKRLRHRDQKDLNDALACAVTRPVGDGGQAWGRKASSGDISPLVAVTNAAWGLRKLDAEGGGSPSAWLL